jgi:hypothetical protein
MSSPRVNNIRQELLDLHEYTKEMEPALHDRLFNLYRWIREKKDGLLTNKNHVLNLLEELIADSWAWLNYSALSVDDQVTLSATLSPAQRYWSLELFPMWFHERDPKLDRWKQELMAGNFNQSDFTEIITTCKVIGTRGGSTQIRYLLDLSMATDMIACSACANALPVQLTTLNIGWIENKRTEWVATLQHWGIRRAFFLSYNPLRGQLRRAERILRECDDLTQNGYTVDDLP